MVNMPRFFFNIRNGDDYIADPDGTELADLDAAVEEALTGARELLSEIVRLGKLVDGQSFEITDETGAVVWIVPFKDAVRFS